MAEQDIIEGNKLIAEFMNLPKRKALALPQFAVFEYGGKLLVIAELQYHTSWDWLMPVWFKFRDLEISRFDREHQHTMWKEKICRAFVAYDGVSPRFAFDELVQAIQWYNSEQKVKGSVATKAQ